MRIVTEKKMYIQLYTYKDKDLINITKNHEQKMDNYCQIKYIGKITTDKHIVVT